jgi:outer membrane protein OmpA-like peptidoglycan-associated protein
MKFNWLHLLIFVVSFGLPDQACAEKWVNFNEIIGALSESGGEKGQIELSIPFSINSDRLKPIAKNQLLELARALKSQNLLDANFEIAGHTDSSGRAEYNKKLSLDRAKAVKRFLTKTEGVASDRLTTIGWGSEKLKDPLNPTGAINRRVVIKSLSLGHSTPEKSFSVNDSQKEDVNIQIDW